MRIFVTIGTMRDLSFSRIFKVIDELCEEGILDGTTISAQMGAESYQPNHFKGFEMLEDDAFRQLIRESDVIISHAGTGTVTTCLKLGKKVIVFPRMAKYKEHYDNHQIELSDVFTQKGYVLSAHNKDQLKICLQELDSFKPQPFISNNQLMNQIVMTAIDASFPS